MFCFSRSCLYILIKIWEIQWLVSHSKSFNQLTRQVFFYVYALVFHSLSHLFITIIALGEGNLCIHMFIQVLSDFTKKNSYDEQLRKEESQKMTPRSRVVSQQVLLILYVRSSIDIYCNLFTKKIIMVPLQRCTDSATLLVRMACGPWVLMSDTAMVFFILADLVDGNK